MKADLMLAQLLSIRATVEALIAEVEESGMPAACCDQPRLVKNETYGGIDIRCLNCGKEQSAPGGPNQEEVRSNGGRETE